MNDSCIRFQAMESYKNEIKDPATSYKRRRQLEFEVQQRQAELQSKKKAVFSIERKLLGVDSENDGK